MHLGIKFSRKMWFKKYLEKKNKNIFPCGALLLYVVHEVFIKVLLFQETCPVPKNPWLCACNFQLNLSS